MKSRTITSGSSYNVLSTDETIFINKTSTTTFTLQEFPLLDERHEFKDIGGNAATYNQTISGNGFNIDGASTYVISTNYGGTTIQFNGNQWGVIS